MVQQSLSVSLFTRCFSSSLTSRMLLLFSLVLTRTIIRYLTIDQITKLPLCSTMEPTSLNVLTLNCWGIPYLTKDCNFRLSSIADKLSNSPYDIVALQEIWTEHHYNEIKKKVKHVLPYSHYFYSGVIGTGLCIFSKYPIVGAFLYQFSTNGQFYAIAHGDWFAGKGIGYCQIRHPQGTAHTFNLHLHADYPSNQYTELRTLQAFQCAQLISKLTRPGDAIILCGDFNHTDSEIGVRAIKSITGLKDSWRSTLKKPPGPCCTINTDDNPYGHLNETTKRIDFIFHSENLQCVENGMDFEEIPGTKHHYSDHKGVSALFLVNGNTESAKTQISKEDRYEVNDEKILNELYDSIARGFKLAEEYKWKWIVPVWILLLTFILMPVFSEDGIYVLLPLFSQFPGEVVFFTQLICIVLSVSYFWNLVILKRMEKHAYLNAMIEIKLKLRTKHITD